MKDNSSISCVDFSPCTSLVSVTLSSSLVKKVQSWPHVKWTFVFQKRCIRYLEVIKFSLFSSFARNLWKCLGTFVANPYIIMDGDVPWRRRSKDSVPYKCLSEVYSWDISEKKKVFVFAKESKCFFIEVRRGRSTFSSSMYVSFYHLICWWYMHYRQDLFKFMKRNSFVSFCRHSITRCQVPWEWAQWEGKQLFKINVLLRCHQQLSLNLPLSCYFILLFAFATDGGWFFDWWEWS